YSGQTAAAAFRCWRNQSGKVRRVVLIGPSHYLDFPGIALPGEAAFETPLGIVRIDQEAVEKLKTMRQVVELPQAHQAEHCIEVELPFLQAIFSDFTTVPLVIGTATDQQVLEVIQALWCGNETRFVLSSDLSHYLPYEDARELDRLTANLVENLIPETLSASH